MKKSNKLMTIVVIVAVVVVAVVGGLVVTGGFNGQGKTYQSLVEAYETFEVKPNMESFEEIQTYLNELDANYKDVSLIKEKSYYVYGKYLAKLNRYEEAMTYLNGLSDEVMPTDEFVAINFKACNKKIQAGESDIDCINFLAQQLDSEIINAKDNLLLAIYNTLSANDETYVVMDDEALILDNGFESVEDYYQQLAASKYKFKAKHTMFVNYQN